MEFKERRFFNHHTEKMPLASPSTYDLNE